MASRIHTGAGNRRSVRGAGRLFTYAAVLLCGTAGAQDAFSPQQLASLSLEEPVNLEITSVSRRTQPVSSAPASIYVITSDDFRRSGAARTTNLTEMTP